MKSLSMAGWIILAKLVIEALPTYTMQVTIILTITLNDIEKHQRPFIWGHETSNRKIHTIS